MSEPTVFLVDDEASVREALERLFRSAGLTAVAYASPFDFLSSSAPDTPGCLVLDLSMPGLDGIGVQRKLNEAGSLLPIIFLTGRAELPDGVRAMKQGALDFAAMLNLEAASPDWTITFDGIYANLGQEGETPRTQRSAEGDVQQLTLDATGLRRVAGWAEVGIGGRVNSVEAGFSIAPGDGVADGTDVSDSRTWFDPLVVARLTAPMDNAWRLGLKGDLGGFGVGSDITWSVYGSVGYRFGDLFELTGGYRALGMEYEDDSGEDHFSYDMTLYGPQIGVAFHF